MIDARTSGAPIQFGQILTRYGLMRSQRLKGSDRCAQERISVVRSQDANLDRDATCIEITDSYDFN